MRCNFVDHHSSNEVPDKIISPCKPINLNQNKSNKERKMQNDPERFSTPVREQTAESKDGKL
jgi:hypothetical protein